MYAHKQCSCLLNLAIPVVFLAVIAFTLHENNMTVSESMCRGTPRNSCYPNSSRDGVSGLGENDCVRFHVYNSADDYKTVALSNASEVLANYYNPAFKVVVIVHGWRERTEKQWIQNMTKAVLTRENTTVILVDWRDLASTLNYWQCQADGRFVGKLTAEFLQILISLGGDPKSFHLMGHSLGAQVCGFTGANLKGIGRITGLDPSAICFVDVGPDQRLDPSDALYVDVLHTDTPDPIPIGSPEPMGTVDFYPNGGMYQPGCPQTVFTRIIDILKLFTPLTGACSHGRSVAIFMSSISYSCPFPMSQCNSAVDAANNNCTQCQPEECPRLGYDYGLETLPKERREKMNLLRVETGDEVPFC